MSKRSEEHAKARYTVGYSLNPHYQADLKPEEPPKKRFSFWRFVKRLIKICILLVLLVGIFLGWKFYENAAKITGDKDPLQIFELLWPSSLNDTDGRVNILLAGNSVDDPGHQGAALTDSIMVVSFDPSTKSAVIISIPRDMWVNIPGFGHQKINAAYEDGQSESFSQSGYDPGGMGLLEEVVYQDFGIQTDYEGLLDYTAFRDAVNSVGGVTVTITSPDPRGLYDPNANLRMSNGTTELNGQEALNLARARGDGPGAYGFPQGDFDRTQHQQQLLIALKDKASSASVITNPLKVASLADAIGNNFQTNMSLGVMITLYRDAKGVHDASINTYTLNDFNGTALVTGYQTPDGEDALVPTAGYDNFNQIQSAIAGVLSN